MVNDASETLLKAIRALGRLKEDDTIVLREQIVETAQESGELSVWLKTFEDDRDMRQRLLQAFVNDEKPRYQHDCDACVFLGYYGNVDLYCCNQHGHPTVIARYSSTGSDYSSGIVFARQVPALAVALERARKLGLISEEIAPSFDGDEEESLDALESIKTWL